MPPKIKTTQEEIVQAALKLARSGGMCAITAKSVAKELGTSVAPIFRTFSNMEALKVAVLDRIDEIFMSYLKGYPHGINQPIQYAMGYIEFAKAEPYLFEALANTRRYTLSGIKALQDQKLVFIKTALQKKYTLGSGQIDELIYHTWIYVHGIASLVTREKVDLSKKEMEEMLEVAIAGFYKVIESMKG